MHPSHKTLKIRQAEKWSRWELLKSHPQLLKGWLTDNQSVIKCPRGLAFYYFHKSIPTESYYTLIKINWGNLEMGKRR